MPFEDKQDKKSKTIDWFVCIMEVAVAVSAVLTVVYTGMKFIEFSSRFNQNPPQVQK